MECFSYVNIFETKGMEYILVIVFLTSLVAFVRTLVVGSSRAAARERAAAARRLEPQADAACVASFRCPYKLADEAGPSLE
jgi:hypothetical protein